MSGRRSCLLVVGLSLLAAWLVCTPAFGLRARRAAVGEEVYDPSLVELKNGAYAWQCCRVCPQNHLLEIDQMLGSTPPPVRRYDDPQPTASTFLEEVAAIRARDDDDEEGGSNNCCNVCPTGLSATAPAQTHSSIPTPLPGGAASKKPIGYVAPLKNLKFSLSRVPMPPCCPYCREASMDEAFNLAVRKPKTMRGLPYLQKKDIYSGKVAFVETEAEAESEAESAAEAEVTQSAQRDYTYDNPSPGNCCNRCLRAPNPTEVATAAGENVWPEPKPKAEEEEEEEEAPAEEAAADSAADETPAA